MSNTAIQNTISQNCTDCDGLGAFSRDFSRSVRPSDPASHRCSRCHGTGKVNCSQPCAEYLAAGFKNPQLNPNVTFSLSCAPNSQDEHDRDRHAESVAWQALIARVHAGEINPTVMVGQRLLSLIPMHATLQEPIAWANVFSVTPAL